VIERYDDELTSTLSLAQAISLAGALNVALHYLLGIEDLATGLEIDWRTLVPK